jgi:uncharacterized membrane protein YraQ (UPF0718 family)
METMILYGIALVCSALSLIKDRRKTLLALKKGLKAFEGILPQFLTVLVIVAAVLAVFDPDAVSALIGERSGVLGVFAAAIVGAITLIPGFVAFPAAAQLLKNGAGTVQIAAFVSTLMMVGVVTLPMEIKYFGRKAAFTRNSLAFVFSFLAAVFIGWVVSL